MYYHFLFKPKGKLDETLGILKKPTKSKKVAKPVAEPAEQSMEWSGRNGDVMEKFPEKYFEIHGF